MIKNFNTHQAADFNETTGDIDILLAGSRVATGMVMHQNDSCSASLDSPGKDFPGMDDGRVKAAPGNLFTGNDDVLGIEQQNPELFLLQVTQIFHYPGSHILRGFDAHHLSILLTEAPSQFESGFDLSSLGFAYARRCRTQFLNAGIIDASEILKLVQY